MASSGLSVRILTGTSGRPRSFIKTEVCEILDSALLDIDPRVPVTAAQCVQALYEEPVTAVQANVLPSRPTSFPHSPHSQDLREAAQKAAVGWCTESGCGLDEQARLQILNPEAFFTACVPSHKLIFLRSLRLGNFLNWGTFLEHYVEEITLNGGIANDIYVDFEHDKKSLVIKFKHVLLRTTYEPQKEVGYRIVVSYSSIHTIVADVSSDNNKGLCLFLLLRWPPQVSKKYPPPPREGKKSAPIPFVDLDRPYDWFRVTKFSGCSKEVLGGCPTLCLPISHRQAGRVGGMEKFFEIIGRLKTRTKQAINFSAVKHIPYWNEQRIEHIPGLSFTAQYALCALLSRGYIVKDQILMCVRHSESGGWNMFMKKVEECCSRNPEATERALDQLLAAIDERKNISLLRAFDILFRVQTETQESLTAGDVGGALEPVDLPYNCVLVRKVSADNLLENFTSYAAISVEGTKCNGTFQGVAEAHASPLSYLYTHAQSFHSHEILVTPTRLVYLPCEVQMSNRVVRTFGEEYALRVGFRDDDGRRMMTTAFQHRQNRSDVEQDEGEGIIENMIRSTLCQGVRIGNRHYRFLAWSNSQMRDHGCYMYARARNKLTHEEVEVEQIRHWMGDFAAIQNVPKLMSRMGQCFTQAQVGLKLTEGTWRVASDVVGGKPNPEVEDKVELYTFSDGIGRISMAGCQKVAQKLELNPMPSAVQVRFAGCKGMLSVDPQLDEENNTNGTNVIVEFRDSMQKFQAIHSDELEIVKYSMQSPVFLNRPLINILDQVSHQQGTKCRARVKHRLHRLLENELFLMADMLCSEKDSVIALTDRIPMGMDFPKLRLYGFAMTKEPFFRGLLLAVHRYNIKEQLAKAKVAIPSHLGRTMYGVMDETGTLQYGQVFVQYSASMKKDKSQHKKIIHIGKVMMTKNPCIVPGDVRLFDAVDIPLLHYHCDVVVFPQNGPRPHPDEMAGSDLDGDEYAVYFDREMMFDTNEKAMTFPKSDPEEIIGGVKSEHMVEFLLKFLKQNTIGYVSNAHLVMSDQLGIFHDTPMAIARECSKAVDFPKTGNPADPLTREQQPYKYPDYFQKDNKPSYRSKWMLGEIYRKTKKVEEILELGSMSVDVAIDADLEIDGWEEYEKRAMETRDLYSSHLQSLMDTYGITDEFSLVSGHMVTMRNRISDNEKDDFSFYNTEKLVELRYGRIFSKFRKEFFKEFGGEGNVDLESPPEFVQMKAYAWYAVTYETKTTKGAVVTRCLSFPWIVWDILAYMKRNVVLTKGVEKNYQFDPIREELTGLIETEAQKKATEYGAIMENLIRDNNIIRRYCSRYKDLYQLMCVLVLWAREERVFERSQLREEHLCMLLILYGLGKLREDDNDSKRVDEDEIDENMNTVVNTSPRRGVMYISELLESDEEAERRNRDGGKLQIGFNRGCFLLDFVKYMGMTAFRGQSKIDFNYLGSSAKLLLREWHLINQVAFKTYHRIALMGKFEALYIGLSPGMRIAAVSENNRWDLDEGEPVMIDLGDAREMVDIENDADIENILKNWSGCEEVRLSRDVGKSTQVRVLARGTLESRHKLRCIVTVDGLEDYLNQRIQPAEAEDF